MRTLPSVFVLAAVVAPVAPAQNQFDLPTTRISTSTETRRPIGGPRMRYQQWYAASEWLATAQEARRIWALWLRAGAGSRPTRDVEIEVTMANSFETQPTSSFEGNMLNRRRVVFPRQVLRIPTSPGWPIQLTFASEFIWDGTSGVVVDIKIWDNGNNNNTYDFALEKATAPRGLISLMYTLQDPIATDAAVGPRMGEGITTRFFFREAISFPYGNGCPGEGRIVPFGWYSNGWPIPGNTVWTHELRQAPSQRNALFLIGGSRTMWNQLTLPHELVEIGANGCFLRAEPLATAAVTTVGGGPGSGFASFVLPVPPISSLAGGVFYSQWLVHDPNAPNGVLAASWGLLHRVGLD